MNTTKQPKWNTGHFPVGTTFTVNDDRMKELDEEIAKEEKLDDNVVTITATEITDADMAKGYSWPTIIRVHKAT